MSRPGRRQQPASRRTAQSRSGGTRRTPPSRRSAPRRERPAPPPPKAPHDDAQYGDSQYGDPQYGDAQYGDAPYEEAPYGDGVQDDAFPPEDGRTDLPSEGRTGGQSRSRRPDKRGKGSAKTGGKTGGKAKRGQAKVPGRPSGRPSAPERQPAAVRRAGGPGPKLYFGAAAVLGVLVLLGLGVVVLSGGDSDPKPPSATGAKIGRPAGTGPSPTSYSSSPSSAAYAGIATRGTDPQALTEGEAFPSSAAKLPLPDGAVSVKLRAKRLDGDCAAAVWGGSVGEELAKGGCTQAARGIYSDTEHGYALAVAVFNLAGSADADRFVARLETTIGAGFVRPLEAPAPLDRFGRGFGMARGLAMGHFAVVSWAQRLDGKGDEKDETLLSLLIEGGKSPAVLGRAARGTG